MILYRLMQWSRRRRLTPLEFLFNKLNVICCNCIIGRGAEFGPGFVLIHSTGVVINGAVRYPVEGPIVVSDDEYDRLLEAKAIETWDTLPTGAYWSDELARAGTPA